MVNGARSRLKTTAVRCEGGWVLIALLFLIAALGTGMAAVGTVWTTAVQREKEAELLFVGEQYRRAIESYQRHGLGDKKPYPPNLESLLLDRRFPMPVRHLRRLYPDPMTGRSEWGIIRDAQGGIIGVHSLAQGQPLKRTGFAPAQADFESALSYRDWVFIAYPLQEARAAKQPTRLSTTGQGNDPNVRPLMESE